MRRLVLICALATASATTAMAQIAEVAAADSSNAIDLGAVVVHGAQPGPRLWKVSKGDHVLWVLGTLSPLPRNIVWKSQYVEALIATSQEVLIAPEFRVSAKTGFLGLGLLSMLPSLIGVRNNPGGTTLKDVVPPELYARWSVLKEKYIGHGGKVEKWRPIFAALDLYAAAIEKTGLVDTAVVQKIVNAAAKRAGVKITTPSVEIAIDDPKGALKEFKTAALDDIDCFRKTLDRIDTDLGTMTARANAWSIGDLDALRSLPYTDQRAACAAAVSETQLAKKRGGTDVEVRAEQAWIDTAERALKDNRVTFAMLPIAALLQHKSNHYLSHLQALGYTVEEPDAAAQGAVQANGNEPIAK